MTAETILTDDTVAIICQQFDLYQDMSLARAIEQAVLQSEQVQALKRDAERYRFLKQNIQPEYDLPGGYYLSDKDTNMWDGTIDSVMEQKP